MSQQKVLIVDYAKCTGCRLCETVCSLAHEGVVSPTESRITVVKDEARGLDIPVFCRNCEKPICVEVCPTMALSKDTETGIVSIDCQRCVGCLLCFMSCALGGISFPGKKNLKKCDLCNGNPMCFRYCPTQAIDYVPFAKMHMKDRRKLALRMLGVHQ